MNEATPFLSLGVMCGDAHAGAALERCLRSVLRRADKEPAVDEVVIGWNGKDDAQLLETLRALGYLVVNDEKFIVEPSVPGAALPPVRVVRFDWPGRFDNARNLYWPQLRGEWCFHIDADDAWADAGTPEGLKLIEDVEREYGIGAAKGDGAAKSAAPAGPILSLSLKQWLQRLPPQVNAIFTTYNYATDEHGYVVARLKVKNLVRRRAGHVWYSPDESGIHELLTMVGPVVENSITNLGLVVQHYPTQTDHERALRNVSVVKALSKSDLPMDGRHAFDLANSHATAGNLEQADNALRFAIQLATNDLDRYNYRLARAYILNQQGKHETALGEAFAAVALVPELQDAYFFACESLFGTGKWAAAAEWYERGVTKEPLLLSKDQPLMRHVQPRGQAALSLLHLGKYEQAQKLLDECVARYPESPLTKTLVERVGVEVNRKQLHDALELVLERLVEDAPPLAQSIFEQLPSWAATRGVAARLKVRTLGEVLQLLSPHMIQRGLVDGSTEFTKGNSRIDLTDVLQAADQAHLQLMAFTQNDPRIAQVKVRPRKLKVALYSPHAVDRWVPESLLTRGLGGSESSVAYLARELSKRHVEVTTFTPQTGGDGAMSLWSGTHEGSEFAVLQKDLTHMAQAREADVIVTCRAPYLIRENAEVWDGKTVWCWHQDNGYGNPWLWSPEVAVKHTGHLHVSEWAMRGLMGELLGAATSDPAALGVHKVLGNGVPLDCTQGWAQYTRNPHRVAYVSDPTRGLEQLLDLWPKVRESVPDAELVINMGFGVMLALKADLPGSPVAHRISKMKDRCAAMASDGVAYTGWAPQAEVLAMLKTAGVYAYPGGPMPEGFGVALVQAQACGCEVVCASTGALPDVLVEHRPFSLEALIEALLHPRPEPERMHVAQQVLLRHAWPVVAERFLELVG